jgi:hypothetical protein
MPASSPAPRDRRTLPAPIPSPPVDRRDHAGALSHGTSLTGRRDRVSSGCATAAMAHIEGFSRRPVRLRAIGRAALAGLFLLAAGAPAYAAQPIVRYDPPWVSVDAQGASVAETLRAIGAKVGFTVQEIRGLDAVPAVSIHRASLEDALRQLLRGSNHVVHYREDAAGRRVPSVVVLLGPGEPGGAPGGSPSDAPSAGAAPGFPAGQQATPPSGVPGDPVSPQAGSPPVVGRPLRSPQGAPAAAGPSDQPATFSNPRSQPPAQPVAPNAPVGAHAGTVGEQAADVEASGASVGDMLRSRALSGVGGQTDDAAGAPSSPTQPPPASNVQPDLGALTRQAQESVGTLVRGLQKATDSLLQQGH